MIRDTVEEGWAEQRPTEATGVHGTDAPVVVRHDARTRLWQWLWSNGSATLEQARAVTGWSDADARTHLDTYLRSAMLDESNGVYTINVEYLLGHITHDRMYKEMDGGNTSRWDYRYDL